MTEDKTTQTCWSEGGQIFYLDGYAWGVSRRGKTIYLGTEKDVKKRLNNEEPSNPVERNIFTLDFLSRGKQKLPPTVPLRRRRIKIGRF